MRSALVTGGARGIGLSVAESLRSAGMRVAICDLEPSLSGFEADADGRRAIRAIACDVTDSAQVEAMAAELEGFGGVDVLVNNAGVLVTEKLVDTTDEDLDRILAVNVGGAFRVTRSLLPGMIERGCGRVIQIASITPIKGEARTTAYAATKGALIGMTKSLSREVAGRGVTVNAVAPGYMLTDMNAAVFTGELGEAIRSQITKREFGTPDDVAAAVGFLASEAADYVTGHVLVVDGGVV